MQGLVLIWQVLEVDEMILLFPLSFCSSLTINIPNSTNLIPPLHIVIKQDLLQIRLTLESLPRKHFRDDVKSKMR